MSRFRGGAEVKVRHVVNCVCPAGPLAGEGGSVQAAADQRYGSSSVIAEAGCVGSRSNTSLIAAPH